MTEPGHASLAPKRRRLPPECCGCGDTGTIRPDNGEDWDWWCQDCWDSYMMIAAEQAKAARTRREKYARAAIWL